MGQMLNMYRISEDPSQGDGFGASAGSLAIVESTGEIYRKYGAGANDWAMFCSNLQTLEYTFFQSSSPYLIRNTAVYDLMAQVAYKGSSIVGDIIKIEILASSNHLSLSASFKIYDVTHAKTICEKTNVLGPGFSIFNMGAISNVPQVPGIFEIQGKQNNASSSARIAGMIITLG